MRLNEIYPAFQGEGPRTGVESVFVRLHHCPVACRWCDTAYTWDGSEPGEPSDPIQIVDRVARFRGIRNVVITGGEPLVHRELPDLVLGLRAIGRDVEIETSGVLPVPPLLARDLIPEWRVSPKMPSAQAKMMPDPDVLRTFMPLASVFKFAIADSVDWKAMLVLVDKLLIPRKRVIAMPVAIDREQLGAGLRQLFDLAAGSGIRVMSRMHIEAHNGERKT